MMKWIAVSEGVGDTQKIKDLFQEAGIQVTWLSRLDQVSVDLGDTDILIVSAEANSDIYSYCRQVTWSNPDVSIILLSEETEVDLQSAIRAGVFDVMHMTEEKEQLLGVLDEIEDRLNVMQRKLAPKAADEDKRARVMTTCSTKGGVGKTTFTVNMTASLAKQGRKVLVIDLDLQFGDVAMFFDTKPKKTIYEWVKEERSQMKLASCVESFNEQIDILSAPIRPEFAEVITDEHIKQLIKLAKPLYDVILIDTAPYMDEVVLTALEESDDIFLVTLLDLPTLRNNKTFLETLQTLNLQGKVKVVLNRNSKKRGLTEKTAEEVLGMPIEIKVPDTEKIVVSSVNVGAPFVLSHPRAKVSKVLLKLGHSMFDQGDTKAKKKLQLNKKASVAGRPV
ncbi:AAA family ATPase [Thalassobacillus devorans]|uniref:AAA family ATPase n=1 Tax=Thalassobacillus devorans TaxID=279813 RepID=UPI00048DF242|nr:AAA family ATPase [Thalassobacillus devorans]